MLDVNELNCSMVGLPLLCVVLLVLYGIFRLVRNRYLMQRSWNFFCKQILEDSAPLGYPELEQHWIKALDKGFAMSLLPFWLCTPIGREVIRKVSAKRKIRYPRRHLFLVSNSLDPKAFDELNTNDIGDVIDVSIHSMYIKFANLTHSTATKGYSSSCYW